MTRTAEQEGVNGRTEGNGRRSRAGMARGLACAWAVALLLAASAGSASTPAGGQGGRTSGLVRTAAAHERRQDRQRILRTIEGRMKDPRVLEKMREKLAGLTDARVRLVASLCERIDAGGRSADAAVAFSLVTALIVLS